eukprot:1424704-Rhodomonas_salina.1
MVLGVGSALLLCDVLDLAPTCLCLPTVRSCPSFETRAHATPHFGVCFGMAQSCPSVSTPLSLTPPTHTPPTWTPGHLVARVF